MRLFKHVNKDVVSSPNQRKTSFSYKMTLLSFCALFLIVSAALISVNLSSAHKAHAATQAGGDFTQKTITASSNQAQISFTPNGWTPGYVTVHFLYANSGPQNANMTYNSDSGSWQYTINGVSLETFIYYSFTYEKDGVQYDSGQYTYLF